jgi:hypothetical protein
MQRLSLVAVGTLLALQPGCVASCDNAVTTDTCGCEPGFVCRDGGCLQVCVYSEDCLNSNELCIDGTCAAVIGALCDDDVDCGAGRLDEAKCLDTTAQTTCQGRNLNVRCVDRVCISVIAEDDSVCAGVIHTCADHLRDIACTTAEVQVPPVCLDTCVTAVDCSPAYECSSGACVLPGTGQVCTGLDGCAPGLQCINDVCCETSGAPCCTRSDQCGNGLACYSAAFVCRDRCTDWTSASCADPIGAYCRADACMPKLLLGSPCEQSVQCLSDYCVDGVCCANACAGPCQACGGDGACDENPGDDPGCGVIDCDSLDTVCRDYADLSAGRCAAFGRCRTPNSPDCTSFTNAPATTVCRPAVDACDIADRCVAGAGTCAADARTGYPTTCCDKSGCYPCCL